MYIAKHKETGEVGLHANVPADNIDFATIHPKLDMFLLTRAEYNSVIEWENQFEQYVSKPAGTYDDGREHPDLYSDRLRGNKIDVLPDGTVQLLNPDGTVASTLMATCQ